jgi:hypothetical protein
MDVPDKFLEVRILLADNRFVAVLEQMSTPSVPMVEHHRIPREEAAYECGETSQAAPHEEVRVVGEERPGVNRGGSRPGHVAKAADEFGPILVIPDNRTAVEAAHDHVVQCPGNVESRLAGHGRTSCTMFKGGI